MSAQVFDTIEMVLEEPRIAACNRTQQSATMTWRCAKPFHADSAHYYVRKP